MDAAAVLELQNQLAIRAVIDRYARHADRRDPVAQSEVFTENGTVTLFEGDPSSHPPLETITGRDALTATFADLIERYEVTTYLNGQSTIQLEGEDAAHGETYCVAFHLVQEGDQRSLLTMSIRYLDRFVRKAGDWLIADRQLVFDWTDRRPSAP